MQPDDTVSSFVRRVNEIVREERGVTPDTALRLARFFGGDAKSWINLQATYDLKMAEIELGKRIDREVRPMGVEGV